MTCQLAKLPHLFTAGDRLPELLFMDDDGTNLTGYTITLHLERPNDTVLIKPVVPIDITQGRFKVTWEAGDLIAGLGQVAEIQFVTPGGLPETSEKFLIDVTRELA
jgi:hypothetical protein